ncbi:hypothetical protein SCA03_22660 [Streptomyces cacaoi]|uniref:Uncharacterized protein n=1 Tax=Streptomyces cacaoi TaxID=1898 RepID=A0A4Y3QWG9_STRCI|nr:hypothetical protein SCA03_22660 [Streptomyces cacaoi]
MAGAGEPGAGLPRSRTGPSVQGRATPTGLAVRAVGRVLGCPVMHGREGGASVLLARTIIAHAD